MLVVFPALVKITSVDAIMNMLYCDLYLLLIVIYELLWYIMVLYCITK